MMGGNLKQNQNNTVGVYSYLLLGYLYLYCHTGSPAHQLALTLYPSLKKFYFSNFLHLIECTSISSCQGNQSYSLLVAFKRRHTSFSNHILSLTYIQYGKTAVSLSFQLFESHWPWRKAAVEHNTTNGL